MALIYFELVRMTQDGMFSPCVICTAHIWPSGSGPTFQIVVCTAVRQTRTHFILSLAYHWPNPESAVWSLRLATLRVGPSPPVTPLTVWPPTWGPEWRGHSWYCRSDGGQVFPASCLCWAPVEEGQRGGHASWAAARTPGSLCVPPRLQACWEGSNQLGYHSGGQRPWLSATHPGTPGCQPPTLVPLAVSHPT